MRRHIFWIMTFCVLIIAGCSRQQSKPHYLEAKSNVTLKEHTKEFRKEVINVTDGVYVAVGFGVANSIMIEGDDGLIIVDTMTTSAEAETVLAEFRKISSKPVAAIIYTHNHADHILGATTFAKEGKNVDVYAHDTTAYYIDRIVNVIRPIISIRGARMFGNNLNREAIENVGLGPYFGFKPGIKLETLRPTITFKDTMETNIAGVKVELIHAPGETNDQIYVWLPEKRALLPGDNFYKAFPNLYTIRGTCYRDVMQWAKSIDIIREKRPEYLVPSHTRPIKGEERIFNILTDYRDAIQYVHDQTIRGINQGLTPDEIVETVKLPEHLAQSPYLQEFYGKVDWSVRSVFSGYIGWFDGNPTNLNPLPFDERARRYVKLGGGEKKMTSIAETAFGNGDYQWVLDLTDHLLKVNKENAAAKEFRVKALTALGEAQLNANARHYYLSSAVELRDGFQSKFEVAPTLRMIHSIPLESIFTSMAVNLDAEKTISIQKKVNFNFPDTKEAYSVYLRNGVAEIHP
ncbi:MAG: MBL fold metallo-hydrolase, partial [Deltaproteobacteria bacterium]|nr:MBL fold metallo-hydrolase [Deltaproteobacteria bacterium]